MNFKKSFLVHFPLQSSFAAIDAAMYGAFLRRYRLAIQTLGFVPLRVALPGLPCAVESWYAGDKTADPIELLVVVDEMAIAFATQKELAAELLKMLAAAEKLRGSNRGIDPITTINPHPSRNADNHPKQ
jgi:hypothetical protein